MTVDKSAQNLNLSAYTPPLIISHSNLHQLNPLVWAIVIIRRVNFLSFFYVKSQITVTYNRSKTST